METSPSIDKKNDKASENEKFDDILDQVLQQKHTKVESRGRLKFSRSTEPLYKRLLDCRCPSSMRME